MQVPMRLLLCFVCLWLLPAAVQAQERVAMSFDFQLDASNHPIVRVQMNKDRVLKFVIDTGSGISMLTEATVRRLGLPSQLAFDTQHQPILIDGKQSRFVQVQNFALGPMRFDIPFVVVNNNKLLTIDREPIDGLIGANVLQDYGALFDFTQHRITLYEGGKLSPQELDKAGMKDAFVVAQAGKNEGVFLVNGQVSNKAKQAEGIFIIDTGSDCCFLSTEIAEQLGLKPNQKPSFRDTFLGKVKVNTVNLERLTIGSLMLTNKTVEYPVKPLPNYTLQIGMNVLIHYRLLLDFPQHTAYFLRDEPASGKQDSNAVRTSP